MKSFDRKAEENKYLYNDKAFKVIEADASIVLNGFYDERQLKNGDTKQVKAKAKIPQSLIITFSRKQFEYQRAVRNRQIERAKKLLANAKDPEEIKKGPNDIRRFIKRKKIKAEENMTIQDLYEMNNERILEEEKYDGFYAIAINLDVLDKNLCAKKPEVLFSKQIGWIDCKSTPQPISVLSTVENRIIPVFHHFRQSIFPFHFCFPDTKKRVHAAHPDSGTLSYWFFC